MVLLIDNYDSFVHNLARYVRELGKEARVERNDEITIEQITTLGPTHVILSPGPCTPDQAGISTDLVRRFGPTIPILGVCLGHQAIGVAYGAKIVRAPVPVHGKTSVVKHDGSGILEGLPSPLHAARYHSLVICRSSLPTCLRVTASSHDGAIMGIQHDVHPVAGVQFHPESAATEYGYRILDRFLHGDRSRVDELPTGADGRDLAEDRQGRRRDRPWGPEPNDAVDPFVPPPVDRVH